MWKRKAKRLAAASKLSAGFFGTRGRGVGSSGPFVRRKIFFCIFRNPAEERPRRGFYLGPQAQPCAEGARCVCRVSFQRPKAPSFFMAATREAASKYTQEKELKLKKSVVVKAGVPFPLGTIGLRKRLPKPLYADKTTDYFDKSMQTIYKKQIFANKYIAPHLIFSLPHGFSWRHNRSFNRSFKPKDYSFFR